MNLNEANVKEGDRVVLPADDEGNPEERGSVEAVEEGNGMCVVRIDPEYVTHPGDDGIREVSCDMIHLENEFPKFETHPTAEGDMQESTDFDKFMDSTLLKEQRQATHDVKEVSPQRRLARGYQEHPLGKIRFGGRRG